MNSIDIEFNELTMKSEFRMSRQMYTAKDGSVHKYLNVLPPNLAKSANFVILGRLHYTYSTALITDFWSTVKSIELYDLNY